MVSFDNGDGDGGNLRRGTPPFQQLDGAVPIGLDEEDGEEGVDDLKGA